ncbi:hypothetical protein PHMEG_00023059 [Phytophthora megakarya]|uniref:Eukaryotic/viral aspartic protease n=1 Tax=Phytophthora megakarya TaxID=4795 RepID=A0A225VH51_9STRA|nr:hypothetical protein PHMEG_00023059 [Phytophthora megakarya]
MGIMDHSVGVDVVLETDFRIHAGMRLDLFHGIARLPDKVVVPLVKSAGAANEELYGVQTISGPIEVLCVRQSERREFRLPRKQPSQADPCGSVGRTGQMERLSATNIPLLNYEYREETFHVRLNTSKYNACQGLTYAERRDRTLLRKEKEFYKCWLVEQPPVFEHREYRKLELSLDRPTEDSVALFLDHLR